MKYFGDDGLPSGHCHSFIDEIGNANIKNTITVMEQLCCQAKIFVCQSTNIYENKMLHISHEPVAYQLLDILTELGSKNKTTLKKKFCDLIHEKTIMEKKFLKFHVHKGIKQILGTPMNFKLRQQSPLVIFLLFMLF